MANKSTELPSNVAIVVPIYKQFKNLDKSELKLIEQIKSVFINREIFIILRIISKTGKKSVDSKLLCLMILILKINFRIVITLPKEFYESFSDFCYIQIIQTDCWVFEDKLDYFSKLGLDYIEAPWMVDGFDENQNNYGRWKRVSLQKVKTFKSIIKQIESSPKGKVPVFKYKKITLKGIIKNFGFRNNLKHYINESPGEDIFGYLCAQCFSTEQFKIADPFTAASYSFEVV